MAPRDEQERRQQGDDIERGTGPGHDPQNPGEDVEEEQKKKSDRGDEQDDVPQEDSEQRDD